MKRAIVIVLDSFGIGGMADAHEFGDSAPDTVGSIYRACGSLNVPNLYDMGLACIDGISLPYRDVCVKGAYARLEEKSRGKDTITGHWELMGIVSENGFSIYQNGFPADFMCKIENAWGVSYLGNMPASGTEIINRLGEEHIKSGWPIVYTSADSVFQIAAHEDIIPLEKLYELCEIARKLLDDNKMGVGRVIARPFTGNSKIGFTRTENRRDYSVEPPEKTVLDKLTDNGIITLGIGKIEDIFAKRGLSVCDHTKNNIDGINATISHMKARDSQFIFTNLVDFDMLYGHRRDPAGYRAALEYFDERLPEITSLMTPDDMLIITADHGCDPCAEGTDHTREYVPFLMKRADIQEKHDLGTIKGFDYVGNTVLSYLLDT